MRSVEERLKKLLEYVDCPETGSNHYGRWGILNKEQRLYLHKLATDTLQLLESIDKGIRELNRENEELDKRLKNSPWRIIDNGTSEIKPIVNEKEIRKETAEKFRRELRNFIYLCDDLNLDADTYEKISNKMDELVKQFGCEIKE